MREMGDAFNCIKDGEVLSSSGDLFLSSYIMIRKVRTELLMLLDIDNHVHHTCNDLFLRGGNIINNETT